MLPFCHACKTKVLRLITLCHIWVEINPKIEQLLQCSNQVRKTTKDFFTENTSYKVMLYSTSKMKDVNSYRYFEQNLMMLLLEKNYENINVLNAKFWYYFCVET